MANPFDQFDAAPASGNPFDQFDQAPAVPSVTPGDVEARKKQLEIQAAAEPVNVARERQTVVGELGGGLKQFASDIGTAFNPQEKDMGAIERALHIARAPLGLVRAAAPIVSLGTSPTLANVATSAGESVSDALTKRGFTTLADILGATASAGIDVASQTAAQKLAGATAGKLIKGLPNVAERTAALRAEQAAKEAGVNVEAAAQRKAAETAASKAREQIKTDVGYEEGISDLARYYRTKEAEQARQALTSRSAVEGLAKGKQGAQEVGAEFQKLYNTKLAESDAYFKPKYKAIEAEASRVKTRAENYNETVYKIQQEGAPTGVAPTAGERVAATAESALSESPPALRTGADLIKEQRRLRDLERNAYSSGKDNLGRQYKELQTALGKDINDLEGTVGKDLSALNAEYAQKHAPFFSSESEIRAASEIGPEAVVDKLVPKNTDALRGEKIDRLIEFTKTNPKLQEQMGDSFIKNMAADASNVSGELSLSKLSSKWGQYADSRTQDKVLKATLGDRYEGMRKLVQNAEQASDVTVDQILKKQLATIDAMHGARVEGYGARLKSLDSFKNVLGEGEKTIEGIKMQGKQGSIEAGREARLEAVRKDFDAKVKALGAKPFPEHAGQLVGSAMILHGAVGLVMGNATGVPTIISGIGVMLTAPMFFRIISKAKGLELMNRAMRAAPGTSAAYSAGRVLQKYMRTENEDNGH